MLIISTEEYTTQHQKTFDDIFRFLELPTHKIGNPEKIYEEESFSVDDPLVNQQKPPHSSNWDL